MSEPWKDAADALEEALMDLGAAVPETDEVVIVIRRSPLMEIYNVPKGFEQQTHAIAKAAAALFVRMDNG